MSLAPPLTSLEDLDSQLREHGFAVVNADSVCHWAGVRLDELHAWQPGWDGLPPDLYLKDGGHYRRRRHANLVVDGSNRITFNVTPTFQNYGQNPATPAFAWKAYLSTDKILDGADRLVATAPASCIA